MNTTQLSELITSCVYELVDDPTLIREDCLINADTLTITFYVDPSQLGYVIGRGGINATSIRNLFTSIAKKNKIHLSIHFSETQ